MFKLCRIFCSFELGAFSYIFVKEKHAKKDSLT